MEILAKNKGLFIGLSCLSIGCLIGSFGYPLQKLEVYQQTDIGQFNIPVQRTFLITENDLNYPYGFNRKTAVKVAQIYEDYKLQKIFLLALSGLCAGYALVVGNETVPNSEIDSEVLAIKAEGKKQLILEKVKHSLAMASKAQRLLFIDEMKSLIEEFGSAEGEILEADEINALYEQTEAEEEAPDIPFRDQFPESMDGTYWKAIQKASGLTQQELITDVLGCGESQRNVGVTYLEFLTRKFA